MSSQPNLTEAEARRKDALKAAEDRRRSKLVKSSTALVPYGSPEELKELMTRMRFMISGGDKLSDPQLWALAQGSYALGLNPVAKEICMVGDTIFPQIRGVRRKGKTQITEEWEMSPPNLEFREITDPIERDNLRIPKGALAYACEGFIREERSAWVQDVKELRSALGPDAPYELLLSELGSMPKTIGIGYITEEEMWEKDNPRWWHVCSNKEANTESFPKKGGGTYMARVMRGTDPCPDCGKASWATVNRYPHTQCARKRAEAHWWYQKCDLPFDIDPSGAGMADFEGDELIAAPEAHEFTEGEFNEIPEWVNTPELLEQYMALRAEANALDEEDAELTPEEKKARAKKGADDLFGEEPEPTPPEQEDVVEEGEPERLQQSKRSWSSEFMDVIKEAKVVEPDKDGKQVPRRIVNILNRSPFTDADPPKWAVQWITLRNAQRVAHESDEADQRATALWVKDHAKEIKGAFPEDWINDFLDLAKEMDDESKSKKSTE